MFSSKLQRFSIRLYEKQMVVRLVVWHTHCAILLLKSKTYHKLIPNLSDIFDTVKYSQRSCGAPPYEESYYSRKTTNIYNVNGY